MDASLNEANGRFTLLLERNLAHPAEKVWRALTERGLMTQWFPCEVEGRWVAGEPLRFRFLHGEGDGLPEEDLQGEVLVAHPPRLLEYRWGTHILRSELIPTDTGCRLVFSESFTDPSWGARNAAGWEMCLENLDQLLNGVEVAEFAVDIWREKFERYVGKFTADAGPQQGMPDSHPDAPAETP